MNYDMYVSHYQQIKEGWGSLTKRTPFFITLIPQHFDLTLFISS